MDINDLLNIKAEIKRFNSKLEDALKRSKDNKGYWSEYTKAMIDVGGISGTKEAGAVKRAALDLKNELTKITS